MESLDHFVRTASELGQTNYSEFLKYVNAVTVKLDKPDCQDPFSEEYRAEVLATYLKVAELDVYDLEMCESPHLGGESLPITRQFPFSTQDAVAVGRYLMGVGFMVREVGIPAGSYIIEYGAGWGHVSTNLAQSGYDVCAIDIAPEFVEIINRRSRRDSLPLHAHLGRFGERPDGDRLVDAVIFFEAFHHSLDHIDLVASISRMLRPGGRLLLGAEPIYESFPVPWGLRGDGHAIWAVRSSKWMELGFRSDYFFRLLLRNGFSIARRTSPDLGAFGDLVIAEKIAGTLEPGNTLLPPDEAHTWTITPGQSSLFATASSRISVADCIGARTIECTLRNYLSKPVSCAIQLGETRKDVRVGANQSEQISLSLQKGYDRLSISSETFTPISLGINDDPRALGIALTHLTYN